MASDSFVQWNQKEETHESKKCNLHILTPTGILQNQINQKFAQPQMS